MGNKFTEIAFTESVRVIQELMGSRKNYARFETPPDTNNLLTENEEEFISERDSFYSATVGETGWPYVQHRGGPKGFLKVLSPSQVGFADFSGNRQYITVGNLSKNNRIALILVDYPNKARLKILGKVSLLTPKTHADLLSSLITPGYNSKVERGFLIDVDGFDWNCPQHITPRWTAEEIRAGIFPLQNKIESLTREVNDLRAQLLKYEGGAK